MKTMPTRFRDSPADAGREIMLAIDGKQCYGLMRYMRALRVIFVAWAPEFCQIFFPKTTPSPVFIFENERRRYA